MQRINATETDIALFVLVRQNNFFSMKITLTKRREMFSLVFLGTFLVSYTRNEKPNLCRVLILQKAHGKYRILLGFAEYHVPSTTR